MKHFELYEDFEPEFTVTIADNGFVMVINAKEIGTEETWGKSHTLVFTDPAAFYQAIEHLSELV